MVTIGYAKYMDSDTYRRYLDAENSCRTMFRTNDVPAKPVLEKRISRKTKEHLGYWIKNIEEIMGVKYTKDTANRVVKCEVNGRNITEDVDCSFGFIENAIKTITVTSDGKADQKRYGKNAFDPKTIGLPITQWLAHYFGLELDEALDTVQRAVDYHGGAEALSA